jgi:hypothetical protein
MIHELPKGCDARRFTVLADSSLEELRHFSRQFMER